MHYKFPYPAEVWGSGIQARLGWPWLRLLKSGASASANLSDPLRPSSKPTAYSRLNSPGNSAECSRLASEKKSGSETKITPVSEIARHCLASTGPRFANREKKHARVFHSWKKKHLTFGQTSSLSNTSFLPMSFFSCLQILTLPNHHDRPIEKRFIRKYL